MVEWLSKFAVWQVVLLGMYAFVVYMTCLRNIFFFREMWRMPRLTPESPRFDAADGRAPLVSIIVPAKDEGARIEKCLNSLRAQDYPNFEILVVDDRSQDDTAAVIARIARRDPRVRLLQIDELPPNWTGKSHALHVAQQEARGEWLFFVDADATLDPFCLSIVLHDCLAAGSDMQSLVPTSLSGSFLCRIAQPLAGTLLLCLYPVTHVNRGTTRESGFAVGAFILIHRDAYDVIGGHEGVRGSVVEDIELGRNARSHGIRLRVVPAPDLARVHMYSSVKQFVSGWCRIFYSAVELGVSRLWSLAIFVGLFNVVPYVVLLASGAAALSGFGSPFVYASLGLAAFHELCNFTYYAALFVFTRTALKLLPFRILGVGIMLYVLGRTIRMCRTHEVTWRGTNYSAATRQVKDPTPI